MNTLPPYQYGSARTMVDLHGKYLQECLAVWKEAKDAKIALPETDHPGYQSMERLLGHIFNAARIYMVWMAQKLDLPDPKIDPIPPFEEIEEKADSYLAHLIEQWQTPLANIKPEQFGDQEYRSNWDVLYSIESMLEHAVMHPILHRVQLEELMEEQGKLEG
ncbi:MAG: hypothetical protein HN855_07860 [Anaerolineae bacterium]|jgi:uncharacterized damage-inducible protein DinB|nr:hypothetical protein [Anaerolineae bacterium]MBT7069880.1 hypothetical protein [Anaerolineae bacterium]MBT7325056.1 hypothetical protein [Anaerolineae bacterium]